MSDNLLTLGSGIQDPGRLFFLQRGRQASLSSNAVCSKCCSCSCWGGTDSLIQVYEPVKAFLGHTLLHNFCSAKTPTYSEGVGGGGWAGVIFPPLQNDALDFGIDFSKNFRGKRILRFFVFSKKNRIEKNRKKGSFSDSALSHFLSENQVFYII